MSTPNDKIVTDQVAKRAAELHDAAHADAEILPADKPSWAASVLAAQAELGPEPASAPATETEPAPTPTRSRKN